MDRRRYSSLVAVAGEWFAPPLPGPMPVDELAHLRVASGVYVICDALERTCYVGSVCRPNSLRGVSSRMREHLRDPAKKLLWHTAWVLPLKPATPVAVVRRIEGTVGVDLAPSGNRRLPQMI